MYTKIGKIHAHKMMQILGTPRLYAILKKEEISTKIFAFLINTEMDSLEIL